MPIAVNLASGELTGSDFARIIDEIPHGIFVKDRDFRFVLVNKALCDGVGLTAADLLGKTDYDYFPKEEADFFRRKDVELFASGKPVEILEEPVSRPNGEVRWLRTTKVALKDAGGKPRLLVGIATDITDVREADRALKAYQEQLEERVHARTRELEAAQEALRRKERVASIGALGASLAHQIRNPLGTISNAVYLLEQATKASGNEDVAETLNVIREEVWHADQILRDLLEFGRLRDPVLRPTLMSEILALLQKKVVQRAGLEFRITAPVDAEVLVDREQVLEVLRNLVSNGFEAIRGESGRVEVSVHPGEFMVRVRVTDTGSGMGAALQKTLFEPFVTSKPRGVGLGLATARTLAEAQGGKLRLVSTSPEGTTFEIELRSAQRMPALER